jgi:putative nucleotidyltransferase with HDIG domain
VVESVLIVEDEVPIRMLLTRWVMACGLRATLAATATQALEETSREPAAVALCDIRMPGRDGLWLASELRARHPETAVIMASGDDRFPSAVASLRAGAIDYLLKPLRQSQVTDAVQRGLEWHRGQVHARSSRERLEMDIRSRQLELSTSLAGARLNSIAAVDALLKMLAAHAPGAREHARRVAALAVDTALLLGITEPHLSHIERGALLHDIGTVAIPTTVLEKPEPPTPAERAIERHPEIGYELIREVPFLERAAEIIRASHERFDGTGSPSGLAARQIPLGSRIIALADAFDAMTHADVSTGRRAAADAIAELEKGSGMQFDPEVLAAFRLATSLTIGEAVAEDRTLARGTAARAGAPARR